MNKRNRNIDFWKFVYSVIIMLCHSGELRDNGSLFVGGSIGVEFFFVVSGYLMVASFENHEKVEGSGQATLQFLKRKSEHLFPAVWAGGIIGIVVTNVISRSTLKDWIKSFVDNVWSLMLIDFSGIRGKPVNGVTWYLSAMLLIMLVLYPIMYQNKEMFLKVIAPAISLFSLGYLYQNFSHIGTPTKWLGLCYKGIIRGTGEICLGAVCYSAAKKLRKCKLTSIGRIIFSFIENMCYIVTLYSACMIKMSRYSYILILLFAIAISCSFSGQTFEYSFICPAVAVALSNFGFYLYLGHVYWARTLNLLFPMLSYEALLMVYIGCSVATALLINFLSKEIKRAIEVGKGILFETSCDL